MLPRIFYFSLFKYFAWNANNLINNLHIRRSSAWISANSN